MKFKKIQTTSFAPVDVHRIDSAGFQAETAPAAQMKIENSVAAEKIRFFEFKSLFFPIQANLNVVDSLISVYFAQVESQRPYFAIIIFRNNGTECPASIECDKINKYRSIHTYTDPLSLLHFIVTF